MSLWAVHDHCLNLKVCQQNQCATEVDFRLIQMWVQVHGLNLEMLNSDNAVQVANIIGKCLGINSEKDMQKKGYIMMKTEVVVDIPMRVGFWSTNDRGVERWAQIKYERLSTLCYGCGSLGHTTQACNREITLSKVKPSMPMYEPWMTCDKQRNQGT